MEEAVEICKLRLFLKLAAQVEPDTAHGNLGIEPLPDIDFNIRAGNTLVGFTSISQVRDAAENEQERNESGWRQSRLLLGDANERISRIEQAAADRQQDFDAFRARQIEGDGSVPTEDKHELRKRLKALHDELTGYLASEYGVDVSKKKDYEEWLTPHHPFHWFVEFYGIVHERVGFDVIIGNPPYVVDNKVEGYSVAGYDTQECGNLYAYVTERSLGLLIKNGRVGVILPLASVSLDGTDTFRTMLRRHSTPIWHVSFGFRPAKLFDGVNLRLTILVLTKGAQQNPPLISSRYLLWGQEERLELFQKLAFLASTTAPDGRFLKADHPCSVSSFSKIVAKKTKVAAFIAKRRGYKLSYHRSPLYWIRAMDFEPYFRSATKERSVHHFRDLHFTDENTEGLSVP